MAWETGRRKRDGWRARCTIGILWLLAACSPSVDQKGLEVLRILPHDPEAYTQGLLLHEGRFYESTGRYGGSTLREVDPESGEVLRVLELSDEHFGEGLALVGSRLIQLTYESRLAFVYDLDTFERVETFEYDTQGWGLCYDGESLFMTAGGPTLFRRDPETFELLETMQITRGGRPFWEVNELACVGDRIYANVFRSDRIVVIDKHDARVVAEIDASALVPEGGRPSGSEAVLNGIAHDPRTDTFYLTGKLWPSMFEVRFIPR